MEETRGAVSPGKCADFNGYSTGFGWRLRLGSRRCSARTISSRERPAGADSAAPLNTPRGLTGGVVPLPSLTPSPDRASDYDNREPRRNPAGIVVVIISRRLRSEWLILAAEVQSPGRRETRLPFGLGFSSRKTLVACYPLPRGQFR